MIFVVGQERAPVRRLETGISRASPSSTIMNYHSATFYPVFETFRPTFPVSAGNQQTTWSMSSAVQGDKED